MKRQICTLLLNLLNTLWAKKQMWQQKADVPEKPQMTLFWKFWKYRSFFIFRVLRKGRGAIEAIWGKNSSRFILSCPMRCAMVTAFPCLSDGLRVHTCAQGCSQHPWKPAISGIYLNSSHGECLGWEAGSALSPRWRFAGWHQLFTLHSIYLH